jgi:hypothetical protein
MATNQALGRYYKGMQLRRGPPDARPFDARTSALRLVKAPTGNTIAPRGWTPWRLFDRYSIRIVAGVLLVSIPTSILLGVVESNWGRQTSIDQAKARAQATAESTAVRMTDWVAERQAELRTIAEDFDSRSGSASRRDR